MINYDIFKDKTIALLIWNLEKENDAHVYKGKIVQKENAFYFMNETEHWSVSLDAEQMDELKKVEEALKEILLHADYYLPLSIADLPDDSNEGFHPTGMKWHE